MSVKAVLWCVVAGTAVCASGQGNTQKTDQPLNLERESRVDDVVYLNAEQERTTCVVPQKATEKPPDAARTKEQKRMRTKRHKDNPEQPVDDKGAANKTTTEQKQWTPPTCEIDAGQRFLVQGRRAQLRVVNRKFFTDYSFNIDGVTQLKQIAIQDLDEAANLQTPITSPVSAAPKGAAPKGLSTTGQLTLRTAHDLLSELIDPGTASNPASELESDALIVEREGLNVKIQVAAVQETWNLISVDREKDPTCRAGLGAPTVTSALACLAQTLETETGEGDFKEKPSEPKPESYSNEDAFRKLTVELGDRITMIQALGRSVQQNGATMSAQLSTLDGSLAQWKADLNTLRGNVAAAKGAVDAYESFIREKKVKGKSDKSKDGSEKVEDEQNKRKDADDVLTALQKAEIKLKLIRDLNSSAPAGKPPLDDAEINRLVDVYWRNSKSLGQEVTTAQKNSLKKEIVSIAKTQINDSNRKDSDAVQLVYYLENALDLIAKQTKPVESAFETDQTNLTKELPDKIDQVNLAQSRMLARANEIYDHSAVPEPLDKWIDLSKNSGNLLVYYTVRRVDVFPRYTVPVVTLQGTAPPIPPVAAPATTTTTTTPVPANGPDTSVGTVVAHGSLQVHDFYRATVVAAFTFSTIKDVSVTSKPVTTGTAADGTSCSATTPCAQPFLDKGSPIPSVVVGVNYYLSPRGHDTYPGARNPILQRLGIFGGVSADRLNSYFLGVGYEPTEAFQLTGGVNFVLQDSISGAYSSSLAYASTTSFAGPKVWAHGAYFGAGLNLSIFRKIFGSVTGLGTKASGGGS